MEVILWFILLIACIIAEVATSISLVTIWFIPGIIVAAILAAINIPVIIQIIVFLIISMIALYFTRIFAKKLQSSKRLEKTNIDSLIGKSVKLLEDYTATQNSSVKIGDIVWTVKVADESSVKKDTVVTIIRVEGNTLIVRKEDILC